LVLVNTNDKGHFYPTNVIHDFDSEVISKSCKASWGPRITPSTVTFHKPRKVQWPVPPHRQPPASLQFLYNSAFKQHNRFTIFIYRNNFLIVSPNPGAIESLPRPNNDRRSLIIVGGGARRTARTTCRAVFRAFCPYREFKVALAAEHPPVRRPLTEHSLGTCLDKRPVDFNLFEHSGVQKR
jgi:hypothetical protein